MIGTSDQGDASPDLSLTLRVHGDPLTYAVQLQEGGNTWTEDLDSFTELQAFCVGVGVVMAALLGARWWRQRHD